MTAGMDRAQVARLMERVAHLDPMDQSEDAINARAAVLPHREWLRANHRREAIRAAWDQFFGDWDIVVCPQMASTAFPHDQGPFGQRRLITDGIDQPYFEQLFWAGLAINAYLPSTVFPTGLASNGLPVGLQAIGGPFQDHLTIEFARQVADVLGGFVPPPRLSES